MLQTNIDKPKVFGLIPARSGSKGIPKKNIAYFRGHPLIYHSIKYSLDDPYTDRTFVTTDSPEIADISRSYGAEVPFLRPSSISGDYSRDDQFVHHFLDFLGSSGLSCDFIALLRPSSPIRPISLVNEAVNLAVSHGASCVRAVTDAKTNPFKCWYVESDSAVLKPVSSLPGEPYNSPRQLLPKYFWQTGQLDLISISSFRSTLSITGENVIGMYVDPSSALDIDLAKDLDFELPDSI